MNDKIIHGEVEVRHEGVNILSNGTRIGHTERTNAVHHIRDVNKRGYITDQEAEARINAALAAEKKADVYSLTSDLPAPFVNTNYFQRYDWDEQKYWLPTLIGGTAFSLILAIVTPAVLVQEHLFPHNPVALVFGITSMIVGFLGFIVCFGMIMAKATE